MSAEKKVYCIAYQDHVPHMDGPRTIRQGEWDRRDHAERALTLFKARLTRSPKEDVRIEWRYVSEWSRDDQEVAGKAPDQASA